jgi:hypothetical protein
MRSNALLSKLGSVSICTFVPVTHVKRQYVYDFLLYAMRSKTLLSELQVYLLYWYKNTCLLVQKYK